MSRSNTDSLERVEAIACRCSEHSGDLRVPVQLLDVLLTLVDKEQLRGYLVQRTWSTAVGCCFVVILLDRKIPKCDLIVGTRGSEDGRVCWVPLDRCDRGCVPLEVGDRGGGCAISAKVSEASTQRKRTP